MRARDGFVLPRGAGGGGGGGGGSELPDSLRSTQIADVLDLISEGDCEGLTNGLKSIYLDGVPLQNADGTYNFADVQVQWVLGTQGQAAIAGTDGVQTEVAVGVTVLAATPVVRTVTNAAVDTLRVTIMVPQLTKQNTENGDLTGSAFVWAIDVQSNGGGFVQVATDKVDGKTVSRYPRAIEFKLPGPAPWDVRVRRVTPDSTSATEVNAFSWSTYTEIQALKLRYPNSALVRTRLNAQAFSRVPVRAFDWMGIRVRVPSNYNPITKVYTGVWNGTFKTAWTDCPAWLYYELVTNPRWGLGRYFAVTDALKWEMYSIGRYCDVMVPDGKGGMEPRFRSGLVLSTREQAYKVLTDLAAIFRGMAYWAGSDVRVVQDAPADVAAVYGNSNVVDGKFTYSGASHSKRHSQVVVWFNSLADFGKLVPEVVVDRALQARYGIRSLELSPLGCWSRGQAQRLGKWVLFSEQMESATCVHSVGFDGTLVAPGSIYEVGDEREAGARMSGRVSAASTNQVTLDADVTLTGGEAYTLTVMLRHPTDATKLVPQTRPVTTPASTGRALTVYPAFDAAPAVATVWLLRSTSIQPTTWRCLAVAPTPGKNEFQISGIRHYPQKFDLIEQGIAFEKPSVSRIRTTPPPVASIQLTSTLYWLGTGVAEKVTVSFPEPAGGLTYLVSWRLSNGPWTDVPPTGANSVDIDQLQRGLLEVSVRTRNSLGNTSAATNALPLPLVGKTAPAADVTGLASTIADTGIAIETAVYPQPDYSETELRRGASWDAGVPLFGTTPTRFSGTRFIWPHPAIGTYKVWAKWIDTTGHPSANAKSIDVEVTAAAALQWANLIGIPANLAGLSGTEAIKNADIVVGGYNLAQKSNDFSLCLGTSGSFGATGLPDHLGGSNATRMTCTNGSTFGNDRYRHFTGLRPGVTYTASVWVKLETAGNFCLSTTNTTNWNSGSTGVVTAAGWQRTTSRVEVNSSGGIDVVFGGHSNGAFPAQQPGNVLVAYFQLEEGNAATQWGAAPEDIAFLISSAQQTANDATTQIGIISNDGILSKGEKPAELLRLQELLTRQASVNPQALAFGITTERTSYNSAISALQSYLSNIGPFTNAWGNPAVDSVIDPATYRTNWSTAYAAEVALLNKISAVAATLADWNHVANIPYGAIVNNDDSAALGCSVELWPAGAPRPTGWALWAGAEPTRETSIVRLGVDALRWEVLANSQNTGIYRTVDLRSTPLPAGTFFAGSFDAYLVARSLGLPGVMVRFYTDTNFTADGTNDVRIPLSSTSTGAWQRVAWEARPGNRNLPIYGFTIFVMAKWPNTSLDFAGDWVFDNFIFALFNASIDNQALALSSSGELTTAGGSLGTVTIGGLGYRGDLNATSDLTLRSNSASQHTITGNSISRTTGGGFAANDSVYSADSFSDGVFCSFMPTAGAGEYFIAGLSSDPRRANIADALQFDFIMRGSSAMGARYAGQEVSLGAYVGGGMLALTYDGSRVRWLQDGVVLLAVLASNLKLSFQASIVNAGGSLSRIRFGALTSNAWSAIAGLGKPQDNATRNYIYRQPSPPIASDVGDIWYDSDDSNKEYVFESGAWVSVRDAGISDALVAASRAQSTADGKINSFYQTSPPPVADDDDLWFDIDDGNKVYVRQSGSWYPLADTRIADALFAASQAQGTANGKVTTYFGAATPAAPALGDLWFKPDQRMYRWSGSAWGLQSTVGAGDISTDNIADGAVISTYDLYDAAGVYYSNVS